MRETIRQTDRQMERHHVHVDGSSRDDWTYHSYVHLFHSGNQNVHHRPSLSVHIDFPVHTSALLHHNLVINSTNYTIFTSTVSQPSDKLNKSHQHLLPVLCIDFKIDSWNWFQSACYAYDINIDSKILPHLLSSLLSWQLSTPSHRWDVRTKTPFLQRKCTPGRNPEFFFSNKRNAANIGYINGKRISIFNCIPLNY